MYHRARNAVNSRLAALAVETTSLGLTATISTCVDIQDRAAVEETRLRGFCGGAPRGANSFAVPHVQSYTFTRVAWYPVYTQSAISETGDDVSDPTLEGGGLQEPRC